MSSYYRNSTATSGYSSAPKFKIEFDDDFKRHLRKVLRSENDNEPEIKKEKQVKPILFDPKDLVL